MPYMTNGKRDYKKEDAWDKKHKGRAEARAARHKARAMMAKKLGKKPTQLNGDVGHSTAIGKGGGNSLANLFMQNASQNRSFSRNKDGSMKSELSKKEKSKGYSSASQKKSKKK